MKPRLSHAVLAALVLASTVPLLAHAALTPAGAPTQTAPAKPATPAPARAETKLKKSEKSARHTKHVRKTKKAEGATTEAKPATGK